MGITVGKKALFVAICIFLVGLLMGCVQQEIKLENKTENLTSTQKILNCTPEILRTVYSKATTQNSIQNFGVPQAIIDEIENNLSYEDANRLIYELKNFRDKNYVPESRCVHFGCVHLRG